MKRKVIPIGRDRGTMRRIPKEGSNGKVDKIEIEFSHKNPGDTTNKNKQSPTKKEKETHRNRGINKDSEHEAIMIGTLNKSRDNDQDKRMGINSVQNKDSADKETDKNNDNADNETDKYKEGKDTSKKIATMMMMTIKMMVLWLMTKSKKIQIGVNSSTK